MAKKPDQTSSKSGRDAGAEAKAAAEEAAARERQRKTLVETLSGYGMPLDELGLLLLPPLSKVEVETRYAYEIEIGPAKAKAQLVQGLWQNALKGNASAQIYLHKLMEKEAAERAARNPAPPSETTEAPASPKGPAPVVDLAAFSKTFKSAAPK
jgi:hypothetical protein